MSGADIAFLTAAAICMVGVWAWFRSRGASLAEASIAVSLYAAAEFLILFANRIFGC